MLDRHRDDCRNSQLKAILILALVVAPYTCAIRGAELSTCTTIWDTGQPLGDKVDVTSRAGWKLVPSDLLSLESNPAAAASDRRVAVSGSGLFEPGDLPAEVLDPNRGFLPVFHVGWPPAYSVHAYRNLSIEVSADWDKKIQNSMAGRRDSRDRATGPSKFNRIFGTSGPQPPPARRTSVLYY